MEGAQQLSQAQQAAVSQNPEHSQGAGWHTSEPIAAGWLQV